MHSPYPLSVTREKLPDVALAVGFHHFPADIGAPSRFFHLNQNDIVVLYFGGATR